MTGLGRVCYRWPRLDMWPILRHRPWHREREVQSRSLKTCEVVWVLKWWQSFGKELKNRSWYISGESLGIYISSTRKTMVNPWGDPYNVIQRLRIPKTRLLVSYSHKRSNPPDGCSEIFMTRLPRSFMKRIYSWLQINFRSDAISVFAINWSLSAFLHPRDGCDS